MAVASIIESASDAIDGLKGLYDQIKSLTSGKIENGSYIQFPKNLFERNDITQYIYFSAYEVEFMGDNAKVYDKTSLGQIYLPLPKSLQVSYKSNWQSANAGGTEAARKAFAGEGDVNVGDVAIYSALKAADEELGGAQAAFSKMAINPMKIIQWESPDFRQFSFTWELVPTSGADAEAMNKVLYYFKKLIQSPPPADAYRAYALRQPPLWNIKIADKLNQQTTNVNGQNVWAGNRFLFQLKDCAITNVDIDFLDKGAVFHRKGVDGLGEHAPNGVRLTIGFTETSILTQEDFQDNYPSGPGGTPTP